MTEHLGFCSMAPPLSRPRFLATPAKSVTDALARACYAHQGGEWLSRKFAPLILHNIRRQPRVRRNPGLPPLRWRMVSLRHYLRIGAGRLRVMGSWRT